MKNIIQSSLFQQLKRNFCYKLDQKRMFVLQVNYVNDIQYKYVSHSQTHAEQIKQYEDKELLVFGADATDQKKSYFVFSCDNEITPYEFIKQNIFYNKECVTDYSIEEVEIPKRTDAKELAKIYLYR